MIQHTAKENLSVIAVSDIQNAIHPRTNAALTYFKAKVYYCTKKTGEADGQQLHLEKKLPSLIAYIEAPNQSLAAEVGSFTVIGEYQRLPIIKKYKQ